MEAGGAEEALGLAMATLLVHVGSQRDQELAGSGLPCMRVAGIAPGWTGSGGCQAGPPGAGGQLRSWNLYFSDKEQ